MLAGTFTSCTKDLDEVGLNASSIDAAKGVSTKNGNPNNNGGGQGNENGQPPIKTGMTVSFSEPNPIVGSTVVLQVNFATLPVGGELKIEEVIGYDDKNNPIIGATLATFVPGAGPFTTEITKNEAGTYEYRAHYIPKGGTGYAQAQSIGSVTFIEAACLESELKGELISSNKYDTYTEYTVRYTFKSCTTINDAKIQGGLTAFTEFVSAVDGNNVEAKEEDTAIGNDKSNSKISWQLGNIASGYGNTFTITFKNIKKNQEGEITGEWSVKGTNDAGEKVEFVAAPISVN